MTSIRNLAKRRVYIHSQTYQPVPFYHTLPYNLHTRRIPNTVTMFTTTALRAPVFRTSLRTAQSTARSANLVTRRYAQQDNRGGKSKLVSGPY